MEGWPERSRAAAINSIRQEAERCGGCGLTPDDAWHVLAVSYDCPTCHDRDVLNDELVGPNYQRRPGLRTRFEYTPHKHVSSASLYSLEGSEYRHGLDDDA